MQQMKCGKETRLKALILSESEKIKLSKSYVLFVVHTFLEYVRVCWHFLPIYTHAHTHIRGGSCCDADL
jgi:hypothetical protein